MNLSSTFLLDYQPPFDYLTYTPLDDNGNDLGVSGENLPDWIDSVVIPSQFGNEPVIEVGLKGFKDNGNIKTVVVSEGVEKVGNQSFRNCWKLTTVRLPSSIESINENAFSNCPYLSSIIVERPASMGITKGCTNMFFFTPAEFKIYVPDDSVEAYKNDSYWDYYASQIYSMNMIHGDYAIIDVSGGVSIFQYLGISKNVQIPSVIDSNNVIEISEEAFALNSLVEKLTIPVSVAQIDNYAFYNASSLIEINVLRPSSSGITTAGSVIFLNNHINLKIYVESGSVSAYKQASNWLWYVAKISALET